MPCSKESPSFAEKMEDAERVEVEIPNSHELHQTP